VEKSVSYGTSSDPLLIVPFETPLIYTVAPSALHDDEETEPVHVKTTDIPPPTSAAETGAAAIQKATRIRQRIIRRMVVSHSTRILSDIRLGLLEKKPKKRIGQ
jgi:hypothetical protein